MTSPPSISKAKAAPRRRGDPGNGGVVVAKKKEPNLKAKGIKEKFNAAYGEMKAERKKERAAEACGCGGKGCKKCDCGK